MSDHPTPPAAASDAICARCQSMLYRTASYICPNKGCYYGANSAPTQSAQPTGNAPDITELMAHGIFIYEIDYGPDDKWRGVRLEDFNKIVAKLRSAPPIAQQGGVEVTDAGVFKGYGPCTCILPQYCDGYCQPIYEPAALASKADGG